VVQALEKVGTRHDTPSLIVADLGEGDVVVQVLVNARDGVLMLDRLGEMLEVNRCREDLDTLLCGVGVECVLVDWRVERQRHARQVTEEEP
jgi:hypothetical protein